MVRIKVHELRTESKADLLSQLKDLKTELSLLQGRRWRSQQALKDASIKTEREQEKDMYFPPRKYAVKNYR